MPVQYYFDNLDPTSFQRLINALLTARFGEAVRLLPLRGPDGGRDAETPPPTLFEVVLARPRFLSTDTALQPGRYLFQVKHHRTSDQPGSAVRSAVVADFDRELKVNVLEREGREPVNYFFLITNVLSSKESIAKVDEKRKELLAARTDIHADVLWQDHVTSWLDQSPRVWAAFRELFAGMEVPILGRVAGNSSQGLPRSVRIAVDAQSRRDGVIRFRQINLEQRLSKLFVDLDVFAPALSRAVVHSIMSSTHARAGITPSHYYWSPDHGVSSIGVLTSEIVGRPQRVILEGGPGQGKSTVSQMLAQLYRSQLLNIEDEYRTVTENIPKARFPFRLELRAFAEWLGTKDGSVEQFLAETFARDAGGGDITVESLHTIVENQPVILIFDGLDEVGSDQLRDTVIAKMSQCIERFEGNLKADLRVLLTTRPPAIAGRVDKLAGFVRAQILPLNDNKVAEFVRRWTEVQCLDRYEREQVSDSFNKRKSEQHVSALVKNPMQLSVLLHFIRLKGEAFPDRRAELYREYFKTVIDRDVEKSPRLRQHRDAIEALHEVIAFEIHSRAESDAAAASLTHQDLMDIVREWLAGQGRKPELADELFRLGEERLGLIMVLKGEGGDARYGFDVQPIREFFTAAFINDKCERNAHELFELMAPRSFWHEVALFLAGLRRANEKADLLSRARALDNDTDNGWRSNGRTIVLQLLQEGVLTTPGHVHREALSFLLELLAPSERVARNEPRGLTTALPDLIKACDNQQPRELLDSLLHKALQGDDGYAIARIWRVACRVISPQELQGPVLAHASNKGDLPALVKLLWPAQAGLDFAVGLEQESSLLGLPRREWARCWFQAALEQPSLTGLDATPNYHEFLIEQFAFQPLFRASYAEPGSYLQPARPYAVWRLCQNIQLLALWLVAPRQNMSFSTKEVDFSGLSSSTRGYIEPLIERTTIAIEHLNKGRPVSRSMRELLATLDMMLGVDGLAAWVASRCAVTLMQYAEGVQRLLTKDGRHYFATARPSKLAHLDEWRTLRRNITPLFRAAIPYDLDRGGRTFAARILQFDLHRSCPSHVRVAGKLESVPAIIVNRFLQSPTSGPDWIDRTCFPNYWIPELVRTDPTLRSVALLANRPVEWFGPSPPMDSVAMKNLLSAVEQSDDDALAAGALFAAMGSKLWNFAKLAVLGKMLEADARHLDIGSTFFRQARSEPVVRIRQIAKAIVRGEFETSLSTSVAAARFLSENSAPNLPPLRSMGVFAASATGI